MTIKSFIFNATRIREIGRQKTYDRLRRRCRCTLEPHSRILAPCHGTCIWHPVALSSVASGRYRYPGTRVHIRSTVSSPSWSPATTTSLLLRCISLGYLAQEERPYRAIIFAWFRSSVRLRPLFRYRVPIAAKGGRRSFANCLRGCKSRFKLRAKPNSGVNVRLCPLSRQLFLCSASKQLAQSYLINESFS